MMTNEASYEALLFRGQSFADVLAYAAARSEREYTAYEAAPESRAFTIPASADMPATVRPGHGV